MHALFLLCWDADDISSIRFRLDTFGNAKIDDPTPTPSHRHVEHTAGMKSADESRTLTFNVQRSTVTAVTSGSLL
jgi:hypothetical protein